MKQFISLLCLLLSISLTTRLFGQAEWNAFATSSSQQLVSGTMYYLKIEANSYHLRYEERKFGINLGWKKEEAANIKFEKQGGGKINCGDKIAIHVKGGGYLKYEKREWGINLVWSSTPIYEWELRTSENKKGTPVMSSTKIGIYNSVENDFMGYCIRVATPTINLGWSKDCGGGWRLPGKTNEVKDYIPYVDKAIKYGAPLLEK